MIQMFMTFKYPNALAKRSALSLYTLPFLTVLSVPARLAAVCLCNDVTC